jgi:hypothetical protein
MCRRITGNHFDQRATKGWVHRPIICTFGFEPAHYFLVPVDQLESIATISHNLCLKPHDLAEQLGYP